MLNLLVRGGDINMLSRIGGLAVSVPASGSSGPSSSLTLCSIFKSRNLNHETFRDGKQRLKGGGN